MIRNKKKGFKRNIVSRAAAKKQYELTFTNGKRIKTFLTADELSFAVKNRTDDIVMGVRVV